MKKVLITGKNSYIGNSFETYMESRRGKPGDAQGGETGLSKMEIEKTSLKGEAWKAQDWSRYEAVLHVAGIAHVDIGKADEETRKKYYQVNRDLAKEAAKKAKVEGVKQFIYLSSIIIYGDSAPIGKEKKITPQTKPAPTNFYGDSKLQGEEKVLALRSENFHVLVLRLPMIYGKDAKGNFPKLEKLSGITPVFPKLKNRRSMLYIGNLCELLRIALEQEWDGVICPQNREIISTSKLVKLLGEKKHRKIILMPGFTPVFKLLAHITPYINKIFGNLEYDEGLSRQESGYCIYSAEDSLRGLV